MCMKPWLLLETEEDRKSSKQNSDLYKTKPDYFYHALTQKIFEKIICFVPTPYISGAKRPFLASGSVLSPKKEFDDSSFS